MLAACLYEEGLEPIFADWLESNDDNRSQYLRQPGLWYWEGNHCTWRTKDFVECVFSNEGIEPPICSFDNVFHDTQKFYKVNQGWVCGWCHLLGMLP